MSLSKRGASCDKSCDVFTCDIRLLVVKALLSDLTAA